MAAVPSHIRERAAATERLLHAGAKAAGVAAASCVFTGAATPLAGAFAFVGALMEGFAPVAQRWAEDPPRRDFAEHTSVRELSIRLEPAAAPASVAALHRCAVQLEECTRWLDASLLAFEREQGARLAKAREAFRERRQERMGYGLTGSFHLRRLGDELDALAAVVERGGPWGELSFPLPGSIDELPDELLAWLAEAGVARELVEQLVARIDETRGWMIPSTYQAIRYRDLAAVARAFGAELEDWMHGGTLPAPTSPSGLGGSGGTVLGPPVVIA